MSQNFYFDLTREFNAEKCVALLASGQAVVYYRLALMSKDGDWILEETAAACERVLAVLGRYGARYRAGAPLDVRWLSGGWSSHFELFDEQRRRIRCDFFSRPPRIPRTWLENVFSEFARRFRTRFFVVEPGREPCASLPARRRSSAAAAAGGSLMQLLSEDDLNLEGMSEEELAAAWSLWFDLAQTTNENDPPFTHGVFVNLTWDDLKER